MKMIQIYMSHGPDQELFGLGEDGVVYVYTRARPPYMNQEPQYRPIPRAEWEIQKQQQAQQSAIELQYHDWQARHPFRALEIGELNKVLGSHDMLSFQGYQNRYIDGATEGWTPLNMVLSKPIPHPDDPTKCERS
jgi:hypothetical protein